MLKLLLGHWRAHRKRPHLLPEEGDVHFEDPSTINPLFEDSDSSVASSSSSSPTRRPTGPPQTGEEDPTATRPEIEQNAASVISELIDVSVPEYPKDSAAPSDVDLPKDNKVTATAPESSPEAQTAPGNLEEGALDTKAEDSNESSDTSVNAAAPEPSSHGDANPAQQLEPSSDTSVNPGTPESRSHGNGNSAQQLASDDENVNRSPLESSSRENAADNDFSTKDEVESTEIIKNAEKMRIYNPPSTSAIGERKSFLHNTPADKNNSMHLSTSKPPGKQNGHRESSKMETLEESRQNVSENKAASSVETKVGSTSARSNETEKPAKLRARAIDELIRKFQGSTAESDNAANSVKTPEKKGNSQSPEAEVITKISRTRDKNPPSLTEDVDKIIKSKREESFMGSATETNKRNQEIEPISNIFKFPPPPPLENLQNKSSLHGKILREIKVPKPTSSKTSETSDKTTKESEPGKTRSDSSLDRTRTSSSSPPAKPKEKIETQNKTKAASHKFQEPLAPREISGKVSPSDNRTPAPREISGRLSPSDNRTPAPREISGKVPPSDNRTPAPRTISGSGSPSDNRTATARDAVPLEQKEKEFKKRTDLASPGERRKSGKEIKPTAEKAEESRVSESKPQIPSSPVRKEPPAPEPKSYNGAADATLSSAKRLKSSPAPYPAENENAKSHSEDSGITRGDQISSEATHQETPTGDLPHEGREATTPVPNPNPRKNRKEKKLKSHHRKGCKNCRHHEDGASIKRSQYDEYYDSLTGVRHLHNKHSDSWTSDLSWEERELLRRLRSRRGTIRSNTPSTRSHRFVDESRFRRRHHFRRSYSDDSNYLGSSLCSCDECWAQYFKEYAYGRTSLRGMSPIQELCTCGIPRHNNLLGRRVQFRADTIHEASTSERAPRTSTPAPPDAAAATPPAEDNKPEDAAADDDRSSQKSSKTKDGDSVVNANPDGIKAKKAKVPEEESPLRFVTPWELEEWDLLMRKELLLRRRRRARCMGLMALAMVVFIGLVVGILMVYLRRRVVL